jgi:hypothetical protein
MVKVQWCQKCHIVEDHVAGEDDTAKVQRLAVRSVALTIFQMKRTDTQRICIAGAEQIRFKLIIWASHWRGFL